MQTENLATRSTAGTAVTLLLAAAASAAIAGAIAYAALDVMPCSWFGSAFEGGCGVGAVMAAILGAGVLSVVLFVGFVIWYFRRGRGRTAAIAVSTQELAAAPRLLKLWRAVFVLMLAVQAMQLATPAMWYDSPWLLVTVLWWLGVLLLLVNAVMAYQVARLFNQQPVVMALASVLVGPIGAIGVFIFLNASGNKGVKTSA